MILPFEGNINPVYPQGIRIYLQATKEIDKGYDKLDISVSNSKDIIDHFISLANKYGLWYLVLMVDNCVGAKNILWQVDNIKISDIHHQSHGYFGLLVIWNVVNQVLPNPLVVSALQNLANNAQEVHKFLTRWS